MACSKIIILSTQFSIMLLTSKFSQFTILLVATLLVASCNNPVKQETDVQDPLSHEHNHADTTPTPPQIQEVQVNDYQTLFITIADTGKNYYELQHKMYLLKNFAHISVDTLNRYYNPTKKEIVIAENDEDEMYRGEYFPRRFPSANLSVEHYSVYVRNTAENKLALVAAICETKEQADSVLKIIQPTAKKAFVLKGEVYAGCMH